MIFIIYLQNGWLANLHFLFICILSVRCVREQERDRDKMGLIVLLILLPGMLCWLFYVHFHIK